MAQLHTDTFQTSQIHSQGDSTMPFISGKVASSSRPPRSFFSHPQLRTADLNYCKNISKLIALLNEWMFLFIMLFQKKLKTFYP